MFRSRALNKERTFKAAVLRHQLTTYFVLTYVLSWSDLAKIGFAPVGALDVAGLGR